MPDITEELMLDIMEEEDLEMAEEAEEAMAEAAGRNSLRVFVAALAPTVPRSSRL